MMVRFALGVTDVFIRFLIRLLKKIKKIKEFNHSHYGQERNNGAFTIKRGLNNAPVHTGGFRP